MITRVGVNTHAIQMFGYGSMGGAINTAGIFTGTDVYNQDATPDGLVAMRVRPLVQETIPEWEFRTYFEAIAEAPPEPVSPPLRIYAQAVNRSSVF